MTDLAHFVHRPVKTSPEDAWNIEIKTMPSSHQLGLDCPGLPFGWCSNGLCSSHLFELTLRAQDPFKSHLLLLFLPSPFYRQHSNLRNWPVFLDWEGGTEST